MRPAILTTPGTKLLNEYFCARAAQFRAKDRPPVSQEEWKTRKAKLRESMFTSMGSMPEKDSPLEVKPLGELKRDGYHIEKLAIQTRPGVWMTASAYVPEGFTGKRPAVLVVHGHWSWARRDPVVQSRCLGLVKLGFFVLAVDAFGAGERYPTPGRGTYHGGLMGSALWPAGMTLLGVQVYDNRRAVDYILSRPEVSGKIGITGASGGGNQSMYAGTLDERIEAVVPVCSVGNYQAYLKAACCVCEVLPDALRYTEEGDVLGLAAPRALMVINASKDAYQFNPLQTQPSIERAAHIFKMFGVPEKLRHVVIDSGHDYNQAMREAMYGWMTKWLKNEGDGSPIPEPAFTLDTPEELTALPVKERPQPFYFPTSLAASVGRELLAPLAKRLPTHAEQWDATAIMWRQEFAKFAQVVKVEAPTGRIGRPTVQGDFTTTPVLVSGEGELPLPTRLMSLSKLAGKAPPCILLSFEGKDAALDHPIATALAKKNWEVIAVDLRGCGETASDRGGIGGAPDHNLAEHALWTARPLLGQWLTDLLAIIRWSQGQSNRGKELAVVGIGAAGILALMSRALPDSPVTRIGTVGTPVSLLTDDIYASGTPMGILAPGLFRVGDVPHFAALATPARVTFADAIAPRGDKLTIGATEAALSYPRAVFKASGIANQFRIMKDARMEEVADL